ncbi:MAG TPA: SPFH domain-containing protein, partial [Terracidiphilus sp.]|nr:SPFH domain-containing protein [Terracidiphilus sp.]
MLALKLMLTIAGVVLLAAAVGIPVFGLRRAVMLRRKANAEGTETNETVEIAWRGPVALALVACLPLMVAASIVVIPAGMGGVRVSQLGGTEPGTLYPGVHFITPMIDTVEMFDLRDHLFMAGLSTEGTKGAAQQGALTVQSLEGLSIGLGVTVRYRLD